MAEDTGSLTDSLNPIGIGLGALQTGIGIIETIGAKKRQRALLRKRKAFTTPDEVFDILNATENRAQSGFDAETLDYLTGQTDQAFSSSIGSAVRLGADPNMLSAIFGQKVNDIMKIGSENHERNMANFSSYLSALSSVGANKAAEQKSQQDMIKDELQAESANLQTASGNISGGLNTTLAALAGDEIGDLYNADGSVRVRNPARRRSVGLRPTTRNSNLLDNNLPYYGG